MYFNKFHKNYYLFFAKLRTKCVIERRKINTHPFLRVQLASTELQVALQLPSMKVHLWNWKIKY